MQAWSQTIWTVSVVGPALPGPMSSCLAVREAPAFGFLDCCCKDVGPLLVLRLELVQSQSGEFVPLPVFSQIESVSQDGGACANLLGPVVVLFAGGETNPGRAQRRRWSLRVVCWLNWLWASRDFPMAVAMKHVARVANRLRENLGWWRQVVGPGRAVHVALLSCLKSRCR